jgi:hypothetical protein
MCTAEQDVTGLQGAVHFEFLQGPKDNNPARIKFFMNLKADVLPRISLGPAIGFNDDPFYRRNGLKRNICICRQPWDLIDQNLSIV